MKQGPGSTKDILEELVATDLDAQRGLGRAAELIDDEGLASRFRSMAAERGRMASELLNAGARHGVEDRDGGTAGGTLRRAWMTLKDEVVDDDHAVLTTIAKAEKEALETYEQALRADLPDDVDGLVRRQFAEVKSAHDAVVDLRDARA